MMPVCGCSSHQRPPSEGDVGSTEALLPQVAWRVSPSFGSFFWGVALVNVPKLAVERVMRILTGVSVPPAACLPKKRRALMMSRWLVGALSWRMDFATLATSEHSPLLTWARTPAMLGTP